jgi:hypothetical protein
MTCVCVQSWDIETTGHRDRDPVFAVGSATLEINLDTGAVREVESRRWVLIIGEPASADTWAERWRERGYEQACWDEFWSKHVDMLNSLMRMTEHMFASEKEMAESIAGHLAGTETRCPNLTRVYDTLGFDVSSLAALLTRHGHVPMYLSQHTLRPHKASYLTDVTRAALHFDPFVRTYTDEQRAEVVRHNAAALPAGLAHTHDPADDARCIAYKWVHFAKLLRAQQQSH